MVTRVEYLSADGWRGATVMRLGETKWHVQRRQFTAPFLFQSIKRASGKYAKSLTSAQGMARAWTANR